MADDTATPDASTDVAPSSSAPHETQRAQRTRNRAERSARVEAMIAFAVGEKRREATMQYGELTARIRARFNGCSRTTAERVIAAAIETLRKDFDRFCADAPRAIFDAYMQLHAEHMSRAALAQRDRDRALFLNGARLNLDSVRDMFGLRSAVDINVNLGNVIPSDAYAELTDEQVDALALLDAHQAPRIIDVPTIEHSVALAGVAIDVIESNGDEGGGDGEP